MKKPKPRCNNCGDETTFPSTVEMEREKLGWCVPCFRYWKKNRYVDSYGNVHWKESSMYKRSVYASSLNNKDSNGDP